MQLPEARVLGCLAPEGPLSTHFKNFEARPEQSNMLRDVLEAYNSSKIFLIEAGTGCGKSMAYLIPALLFASVHKERTIISTNTINLQEQLLNKDIPLLLKALNLSLKTALVKGMNNYICLRKLNESMQERLLYQENERHEIESLADQVGKLKEGSRHELKVLPSSATWDRAGAEQDTCTGNECPNFQECFFFKARQEAQDAQIIIVNHHLLFADLAIRATSTDGQTSLLPASSRLIVDEAHNIEDVATEYFAKKVNKLHLLKTMGRLLADKGSGKLPQLKEKITKHFTQGFPEDVQAIITRLSIDLPGMRRDITLQLKETFDSLTDFLQAFSQIEEETKFRFREPHAASPEWKEAVIPKMQGLIQGLLKLEQSLIILKEDIEQLKNERLNEITNGIRHEINALGGRLGNAAQTLDSLTQPSIPDNQVRWIEHSTWGAMSNTGLVDANLDLSRLFVEQLFMKFKTVILSSATLTTSKKFDYFKQRFGLNDSDISPRVKESIYLSPFNYHEQTLVAVPTDIPAPTHPDFLDSASKRIMEVLDASRGGAFVLFTSYSMLKKCHEMLRKELEEKRFKVFKQGDMPRSLLLQSFVSAERGVLFGTDSFWEGVDVAGDKLRAVIIVKLPFKVPTEPIIQARVEQLNKQGKDPFMEYSLPQAIVKFKQGFGRLIRGKKDRGAIVILDNRLLTKAYGKLFLSSLPKCREAVAPAAQIKETLKAFYKSTYFMTKS